MSRDGWQTNESSSLCPNLDIWIDMDLRELEIERVLIVYSTGIEELMERMDSNGFKDIL